MNIATSSSHPNGPIPPLDRIRLPELPPVPGPVAWRNTSLARRVLSEREKEVLRLVCEGMSNAEIAMRLGVSRDSIKTELKRIFQKISVKNRVQAAVLVVGRSML